MNNDRDGVLLSAQYEIYADWITDGRVEVYFDQIKYPGFFAWIIPTGHGVGKVGVAGREINVSDAMEQFLRSKGRYSTIRKIFAPIWIKGPIKNFSSLTLFFKLFTEFIMPKFLVLLKMGILVCFQIFCDCISS